jgi:4-carboxymuconolactone decarboxylase
VTPRLPPLPRALWTDDTTAALQQSMGPAADRYLADGGLELPAVLGTLMHHPRLAGPFLAYNFTLLGRPALDPRLRELMILRVAWRCRAPYEWVQHVRIAFDLGIDRGEVERLTYVDLDSDWAPVEAAALLATDELLADHEVHDTTWQTLSTYLDSTQLVELVFVVGTYRALAMAFNSFRLDLDAELEELASTIPMPSR